MSLTNIVYIQLLIENNLGVRQYTALVANPYTVASSFSLSNNYSVTLTLDETSYYLTKNNSGQYEFVDLDNNVLKITEDNINFALNIVTNSGYSVSSYNLTKVGQAVVLEIQLSTNEKISILVD